MKVDSGDVFGDNIRGRVQVGEPVSVTAEMSGGEFDATAVNSVAPRSTWRHRSSVMFR